MSDQMTKEQFDKVMNRLDKLEGRMITKSDVFQSVLTVQAFFAATIVGTIVVLSATGVFA